MSTQKGNVKKGAQKYQNTYKFKHNKNSVKTEKIMNSPLDYLCQRCHDIIKWKIDFRKYKPLTSQARCNHCSEKTIIKAYRTICDRCAHLTKVLENGKTQSQSLCTKCGIDYNLKQFDEETGEEIASGYAAYQPPRKVINQELERVDAEME